jgi:DNA-directed RNA polymerase specialized sigma24 family protein
MMTAGPIGQIVTNPPAAGGRQPNARATPGASSPILAQMTIMALAQRCTVENQRFRHGQASDQRYAHELFRRALVERDDLAWEYLYSQYRGLVERWVRNNAALTGSNEPVEHLVDEAFVRFWQAIPAERFGKFPTVAALLRYLQLCASCVVIDSARAQTSARIAAEKLSPLEDAHQPAPDEEVIERFACERLWQYIATQLHSEAERVIIYDSFVNGMKPAAIFKAHRDLFASVQEIYVLKRTLLERLNRDPGLRGLLE